MPNPIIMALNGRVEHLEQENRTLRACIADDTENEELAKKEALKVLTHLDVYGDSYGVPTIADIVEKLVQRCQKPPL